MSCCNQRCTDILSIGIADPDPPIVRALSVQVAFDRSPREIVHHPPARIAACAGAKLGRIDAIQTDGRARHDDGIRIPDLNLGEGRCGDYQECEEMDIFQVFGFQIGFPALYRLSVSKRFCTGFNAQGLPDGLPYSASRVARENRPLACRAFGHMASPRRCARHPDLPGSRARRFLAAPPDCASVGFGRPKRSLYFIRLPRPVAPLACSGRANLPTHHTHKSVEAYPPDGPQISPPQGSQNFSARVALVRSDLQ